MSHKQANLLRAFFEDPHAANIHWREIESLLNHLCADVEAAHGAYRRYPFRLRGREKQSVKTMPAPRPFGFAAMEIGTLVP
jgi:hypothetical protein